MAKMTFFLFDPKLRLIKYFFLVGRSYFPYVCVSNASDANSQTRIAPVFWFDFG